MKKYNYDKKLNLYYIDYVSELETVRIYAKEEKNMPETIKAYKEMLKDKRNGIKPKRAWELAI